MPVSRRLPTRLVGLGLLCTFVTAGVYGKVQEDRRALPYGRFTEAQILERANAFSSTLITQTGTLHVSTHRMEREHHDGSSHPFWFVDYANAANDSVLRLGFDAETGDLHLAEICPPKRDSGLSSFARPGRLDSESAVLKLSRDWVYALGLAPKMGPWELAHNPQRYANTWRVVWQCRDHTLNFSFDRKTGRLMMAQMHV